MWDHLFMYLFIFHNVGYSECVYPPVGDEVQAGSVLLPASRRGRYLANIARRQAVDGTDIKFNKEADRMNAEAKKKVDVLSEELLPYIIAEQERRITLYKRVMSAIQNGEKGVTIAEIRNKPPAIIRKGLMYRCPTNLAPREPDGSGVIMCEDDQKPTPILFESCLSAEDKELFVAENKYFFCNRHKMEGPDLPRNGTSVIACAPCERTPLKYTSQKCALEDTDDVLVHYRYYPDRTYKFVSQLDPLREVCDHWNPCQIGYIFSLPGPDQATPASELWQDTRREFVPVASLGQNYTSSTRLLLIPDNYIFDHMGYSYNTTSKKVRIVPALKNYTAVPDNPTVDYKILDNYVKATFTFHPLLEEHYGGYYACFFKKKTTFSFAYYIFLVIKQGLTKLTSQVLDAMPGQQLNLTSLAYVCKQCAVDGIFLRAADGSFRNLERDKYRLRSTPEQAMVEIEFGTVKTSDFGDYFLITRYEDLEDRSKAISIKVISLECIRTAATVDKPVDMDTTYKCVNASCELLDVLCHGESVLASGGVEHIATSKRISLNFASFDDQNACVYLAKFKIGDVFYRKNVAIFEKVELVTLRVKPPAERAPFDHNIKYKCISPDCRLNNLGDSSVTIVIKEYSSLYEGVYQGVFALGADQVTKTLLEIGPDAPELSMRDSGRKHENQNNVPDGGKETLLPGGEAAGEPERKHSSAPGTRRSATNADKSTP